MKLLSISGPTIFSLLIAALFGFSQPAAADTTERASISSSGGQSNGRSHNSDMSPDGRYVAFVSAASNLVANDTNGYDDIFVHDRTTGVTERASLAYNGAEADNWSSAPRISADGRFVAFSSYAQNLIDGTSFYYSEVFLRDRLTGTTERVSIASDGSPGNNYSYNSDISDDGRYVVFISWATNLVANDTNGTTDIFVHDRNTGTTEAVSVASDGTLANGRSWGGRITGDGKYVVFASSATNLVTNDTNGVGDIFVHNRLTGVTERVSISSSGVQANDGSGLPDISADGQVIAFSSYATNLVAGDTNGWIDIFVHDRSSGETTRVSVNSQGGQTDDDSFRATISSDGRYVAFLSYATTLIPNANWWYYADIFLHDRVTATTEYISIASDGSQGNDESDSPTISADGQFVGFSSYANNLIANDTNGTSDVFIRVRQ